VTLRYSFKARFHLHGSDRTGTDRIGWIKIYKLRMHFSVIFSIQIDPERILKSLKKVQRFFDPATGSERIDFISQSVTSINQCLVFLSRDFNKIQKNNKE